LIDTIDDVKDEVKELIHDVIIDEVKEELIHDVIIDEVKEELIHDVIIDEVKEELIDGVEDDMIVEENIGGMLSHQKSPHLISRIKDVKIEPIELNQLAMLLDELSSNESRTLIGVTNRIRKCLL